MGLTREGISCLVNGKPYSDAFRIAFTSMIFLLSSRKFALQVLMDVSPLAYYITWKQGRHTPLLHLVKWSFLLSHP
jgi:hypothetical protein